MKPRTLMIKAMAPINPITKTPLTTLLFKGPTIATRAASKWGGVMIKTLDYLLVCYTQCSILTVSLFKSLLHKHTMFFAQKIYMNVMA